MTTKPTTKRRAPAEEQEPAQTVTSWYHSLTVAERQAVAEQGAEDEGTGKAIGE